MELRDHLDWADDGGVKGGQLDGASRIQYSCIGDSWMEAFDGDMAPATTNPTKYPLGYIGVRHQGGVSASFFNGHAKWLSPGTIANSRDLTGCSLVHKYPATRMCDTTNPGYTSTTVENIRSRAPPYSEN